MISPRSIATTFFLISFFPSSEADIPPFYDSEAYAAGLYGNYTRQTYLSDDTVQGPVAHIIVPPQPGVSPSRFIGWAPGGPELPLTQPMLLDGYTFATVWAGPVMGVQTIGPTVQTCNGTQYLTWWSGDEADAYKQELYYVYDNRYQLAYNVTAKGDLKSADAHEIYLTPNCTAIITAYAPEQRDLSFYNINNGYIIDSYFQEIDLATDQLLFQWKASDHMDIFKELDGRHPLLEQGTSPDNGHDWAHINSVQKDHRGNYLVSSRHAFTIWYISGYSGEVVWRLGGAMSDFKDMCDGKATDFAFQHHARWLNDDLTRLSLFDDRSAASHINDQPLSRGIILRLDYDRKEVWLEHEYNATNGIEATREGSMQVLEDSPEPGNVMLGYGEEPAFTEFHKNGTVLLDVVFGPLRLNRGSADNYRALKVNWTGLPYWGPKIAAGPSPAYVFDYETGVFHIRTQEKNGTLAANDTAYFSWNGATEVSSWAILASNNSINLTFADDFLAEVPKGGFEDHVFVGGNTQFVAAVAIDAHDNVLGATDVLGMAKQAKYTGPAGEFGNVTDVLTADWRAFVFSHTARSPFAHWHSQLHKIGPDTYHPTVLGRLAVVFIGAAMLSMVIILAMAVSMAVRNGKRILGWRRTYGHKYSEVAMEESGKEEYDGSDSGGTYFDEVSYLGKSVGSSSVRSICSSSTMTSSQ